MIELDGTDNKAKIGANSILAVSLAAARAAATAKWSKLIWDILPDWMEGNSAYTMPVPMMNIINGGEHADNNVDIQEFMIQPVGAPNFAEALRYGAEIFSCSKVCLEWQGLNTAVGDEGGFAPILHPMQQHLMPFLTAIEKAGLKIGENICLALDCAASEFYRDGKYDLSGEGRAFSGEEFADYLADLSRQYPILSIEDGMDESDWDGWSILTEKIGNSVQLVEMTCLSPIPASSKGESIPGVANSILIKFNQIGTLTETLAAIAMAKNANYTAVISTGPVKQRIRRLQILPWPPRLVR